MTVNTKSALILAVAIVAATGLWIYFSPYQTCVRAIAANGNETRSAQISCANMTK
ncbi:MULTISPECIES: hypothetical protein [unclassified Mesorhizobium]|uniref:hypothetical protein n=1 Tax=unclassified Mesorhizobium TaxID=325217 RepID=UPI001676AE58|nr:MULTISPECIES: hypothetical protein [unclassified Mesorhizobium]